MGGGIPDSGRAVRRGGIAPAEPVGDNVVAFVRAMRGQATYPITVAQPVETIALLEAVFRSAASGRIAAAA